MWLYIVGSLIVIGLGYIAFILYRGYQKVKPSPLPKIPCPPLTHTLGHIDKMYSPLKHELRLEVCEAARSPYHQFVMMKHASVFVNDAAEASRLLELMKLKGPIYAGFRLDPKVPDLFSADGDEWKFRADLVRAALSSVSISHSSFDLILDNLTVSLTAHTEKSEAIDMSDIFTLAALDFVCSAVFGYDLGASEGSEDGKKLLQCLVTLAEDQAGKGIYASKQAKKFAPQEIAMHAGNWRAFLNKLLLHIRNEAAEFKSKHGELTPLLSYGHALLTLEAQGASSGATGGSESFGEKEVLSEIHQVLRHGHETIAGTLSWLFYALHKYPQVRASLEQSLVTSNSKSSSDILERIILETLRRFPVAGNLTVRSVEGAPLKLCAGHTVPVGHPVHLHMFSLQNTTREWDRPREFLPDRWIGCNAPSTSTLVVDDEEEKERPRFPRCPFLSAQEKKQASGSELFDGVGHTPGSLSFFPFSAGARSCPAKSLSLQIIRRVLAHVVVRFRLDPVETASDNALDIGISANAVILPLLKSSLVVKVSRANALGVVPALRKADDGWADDEEDNIAGEGERDQEDEREDGGARAVGKQDNPVPAADSDDEQYQKVDLPKKN